MYPAALPMVMGGGISLSIPIIPLFPFQFCYYGCTSQIAYVWRRQVVNTQKNVEGNQQKIKLEIPYLKEIWNRHISPTTTGSEIDHNYFLAVFDTLGIGLEPTYRFLSEHRRSFNEFEDWAFANSHISPEAIEMLNSAISNAGQPLGKLEAEAEILDEHALKKWDEEGYTIVPNAIPKADCEATVDLIYDFLQIDNDNKSTWYSPHPAKQGIMVQLFKHPLLQKNRLSKRIRDAYRQIWNRPDLIVSMDRVSFNPPESDLYSYKFPGPNLHWDVSLKLPIPFGVQGLLHLTDTQENQGAFTLVPGFHNRIENWLQSLPKNSLPREEKLDQLGAKSISAKAGDLIIWNQCLPHGSSPNTSAIPRIVQYINYQPLKREIQPEWI